ncbi:MAG: GNAT family N-acetyltransferase, partial [Verrucomicrobia bacterium]|nr:GNAT family N-acetyltransferase [Verrucomicrobiota bacterium]
MSFLSQRFTAELINNISDIKVLESEWIQLWRSIPSTTPFQAPAWTIFFFLTIAKSNYYVLTFRRAGILSAIFPFYIYQDNGVRKLMVAGSGLCDYLDLIADPDNCEELKPFFWDALHSIAELWDICEFQSLCEDANLRKIVPAPHWRCRQDFQCVSPVLYLSPESPRLWPVKMSRNLAFARRALNRQYPIRYQTGDRYGWTVLFDALLSLHRKRWRDQGGGVFNDVTSPFHRAVAGSCLELGILRLHALFMGEEIVAVLYGFKSKLSTFYYVGGFNPDLSQFSPGSLIIA